MAIGRLLCFSLCVLSTLTFPGPFCSFIHSLILIIHSFDVYLLSTTMFEAQDMLMKIERVPVCGALTFRLQRQAVVCYGAGHQPSGPWYTQAGHGTMHSKPQVKRGSFFPCLPQRTGLEEMNLTNLLPPSSPLLCKLETPKSKAIKIIMQIIHIFHLKSTSGTSD